MPEIGGLDIAQYGRIPEEVERDRVKRMRRLMDAARSARFQWDAKWVISHLLMDGQHWVSENRTRVSSGGRTTLRLLDSNQTDGGPDEVRVTINRIRDVTEEVTAILLPETEAWECLFDPDERDATQSAEDLAIERRVWADYLQTVPVPERYSVSNRWRTECGSGLLKAVPEQGNPFGWTLQPAALNRMAWDPANKDGDIDLNHNEWADTMAWAAEDVTKAFGIAFPKPEELPALGTLRAFDNAMRGIQGVQPLGSEESKTPGVLITEYFWDQWRRLTLFVHIGTGENQVYVVWDGPNPYGHCPYLKIDYGESLLSPWGTGVPLMQKAENQILNQAATHAIRHLLTGAPKVFYAENSIENPQSAFSNRINSPVAVKRVDNDFLWPQYSRPPDINQVAWQLVGLMPQMMMQKAHMQAVLLGQTSPRGESNSAILTKLGQAGRTFVTVKQQDESRIKRFLTYHVKFLCETANPKAIFDALGSDMEVLALRATSRTPRIPSRIAVRLRPGLARTPAEKKSDLKEWAAFGLFDADTLKWEIFQQTGEPISSDQYASVANAAEENWMLLQGVPAPEVDAKHFEPHAIHIAVHRQPIQNRHTKNVPPEVVDQFILHIADHYEEWGDEMAIKFGLQAEAQGIPNQTDAAMMNLLAPSPAMGSAMAPQATAGQYGARDATNRSQQAGANLAPVSA